MSILAKGVTFVSRLKRYLLSLKKIVVQFSKSKHLFDDWSFAAKFLSSHKTGRHDDVTHSPTSNTVLKLWSLYCVCICILYTHTSDILCRKSLYIHLATCQYSCIIPPEYWWHQLDRRTDLYYVTGYVRREASCPAFVGISHISSPCFGEESQNY